jgi:hypothetical protein
MATVNIDTSGFEKDLQRIKEELSDKESLLRPVCVELSGIMNDRIHEQGKASDDSEIGQYKTSYLRMREAFNHPRTERKVILVLSRKLSNSWGAFATDKGYAVGFTDSAATEGVTGLKKIQYAEEHFGKKIGDMTKEEETYAFERLNELSTEIIGRS